MFTGVHLVFTFRRVTGHVSPLPSSSTAGTARTTSGNHELPHPIKEVQT